MNRAGGMSRIFQVHLNSGKIEFDLNFDQFNVDSCTSYCCLTLAPISTIAAGDTTLH
jgi:hypothetical protein